MENIIDEKFISNSIYKSLLTLEFVYKFENTDQFYIDKINVNYKVSSWLLYIEGELEKRCKKGILICKDRIIMKNDNGVMSEYLYDDFSKLSIGNTENCLFINGNIITIPGACNLIGKILNEIKGVLKKRSNKKIVQVRSNIIDVDAWFYINNENINGPYSKEDLILIFRNLNNLRLIKVWNSSFYDWRFVDELDDFSFLFNYSKKEESEPEKTIDLNDCTYEELLRFDGVSVDAAKEFIIKRREGYFIKNKFEFQQFFNLKPHQVQEAERIMIFKTKINKKARKLDI